MEILIQVKNATVEIDGKTILKPISYRFENEKVYGIIGPNGAGKSTLLKIISGFLTPTSGEIYFHGKALTEPDKRIAVVWQKPYMFQTNVFQNVAYGLKVRGVPRKERKEQVLEILKQFQIDYLIDQKAKSLSGGEMAKVAIARAIITSPQVLILDEPTASLDPQNVLEIEQLILKLKNQFQMTVIMVTHNMFQAKRIADETLFLHSGYLIESQATRRMFENPIHELTKKFILGEVHF